MRQWCGSCLKNDRHFPPHTRARIAIPLIYSNRSGVGTIEEGLRPALSYTERPDEEPRNGPTGSKLGLVQNEELASSVPVSGPDRNRRVPKSGPMVQGIGHLIGEIQMHLTIYGILVRDKACIAERG